MVVLAKAVLGKEFLYDASSSHEVSKTSADVICKALNDTKYKLKDGEIWHRFDDFCQYSGGWAYATCQKFTKYKGRIREVRNYYGLR